MMLTAAILIPFAASVVAALSGRRSNLVAAAGAVLTFASVMSLYPDAGHGAKIFLSLPGFASSFGLNLGVDMLAMTFSACVSFVWLCSTVYSIEYMSHEENQPSYQMFSMLTLGAALGVILSRDLLTMLLFFETMTFTSYFMVIHSRKEDSLKAGNLYLFLGVVGGLMFVAGTALLYHFTGSVLVEPVGELLSHAGIWKAVIAVCLISGFGIKAGMVPLHVWLPHAHPVAPSPASALLSGILIKTGAYGIIRVVSIIFMPAGHHHVEEVLHFSEQLGLFVIWVGIATMLLGVCMALLQENAKKMLAYHSVSQMGYILMGLGVAGYLGHHGAMGMAGGLYHIVNHALFKSALFLVVGAVYLKTHQLNMYKLGGLARYMPFTALVGLLAALGISGFPGLNGYASKTLLHHAIVEAAEHGGTGLLLAEKLFVVTGGGTACSFIKLFKFVFLGKTPEGMAKRYHESIPEKVGMGLLALVLLLFGLFPNLFLDRFIIGALNVLHYDASFVEHHLLHMRFFTLHDISGVFVSIGIGIVIFVVGVRYHLFHWHPPKVLSIEWLVRSAGALMGLAITRALDGAGYVWDCLLAACKASGRMIVNAERGAEHLQTDLSRWLSRTYRRGFITLRKIDHVPAMEGLFREINVGNFNFSTFILIVALAGILLWRIPFTRLLSAH